MATLSASFGQGDGPIHISNVRCNGSETQLQACAYSLSNSCTHSSDAGIMCVGKLTIVGCRLARLPSAMVQFFAAPVCM